MVGYIWVLWIVNILFNLIILLNFLIAIISKSFETVDNESEIMLYNSKCDFLEEVALFKQSLTYFFPKGKCSFLFILQAPMPNSTIEADANAFYAKVIKEHVTETNNELQQRFQDEIADIHSKVVKIFAQYENS